MHDADIVIRYGEYRQRQVTNTDSSKQIISQKSALVSWFVSNCKPLFRRLYANELSKHVKLDVFGNCSNVPDPCGADKASCSDEAAAVNCGMDKITCLRKLRAKYKFYLAFENGFCTEYITEKFWEALKLGNVPIAAGASIKDYEEAAPPNSFLHIDNFTSVEELGDYLKYLDSNPDVYKRYHAWRDKFEIKENAGWWWWDLPKDYGGPDGIWCKVCQKAHQLNGEKMERNNIWKSDTLCTNGRKQIDEHQLKYKTTVNF